MKLVNALKYLLQVNFTKNIRNEKMYHLFLII